MATLYPKLRTKNFMANPCSLTLFLVILLRINTRKPVRAKIWTKSNPKSRTKAKTPKNPNPSQRKRGNQIWEAKLHRILSKSDVIRMKREQNRRGKQNQIWRTASTIKLSIWFNCLNDSKREKHGKGDERRSLPFPYTSHQRSEKRGGARFKAPSQPRHPAEAKTRCNHSTPRTSFFINQIMNILDLCDGDKLRCRCYFFFVIGKTEIFGFDLWKNVCADLVCLWANFMNKTMHTFDPNLWVVRTIVFEQSAHWNPSEQHEPMPTLVEETEKSSAHMNSFD